MDGDDSPTAWMHAAALRRSLPSKAGAQHDRDHLSSCASQPCLVYGRTPSDAHHVEFASSARSARKVSDRFTVPICRLRRRELHRRGNERASSEKPGLIPSPSRRPSKRTHTVASLETDASLDGTRRKATRRPTSKNGTKPNLAPRQDQLVTAIEANRRNARPSTALSPRRAETVAPKCRSSRLTAETVIDALERDDYAAFEWR